MRTLILIACLGFWSSAHAALSASPSFVEFFDTPINGFGKSMTVTVQNLGPHTVQVQTNTSCFGDFIMTSFCNLTLGPNQFCQIEIRFQPRQEGQQSCSISINDGFGDSAFIGVSGRGVRQN